MCIRDRTGNTGKIDWVKAATSTTVTADKKIDLTLKVKDGADTDADSHFVTRADDREDVDFGWED